MTRTKTTKLVAIVMAVFMAFTFFCFSVVTTVRAEDGEDETSSTSSSTSSTTSSTSSTEAEKTAPTPDIALTTYTYGAPDINVTIDFNKFSNLKFENNKVTFTVPLNKSNLAASTTYYLFLGKALNETTEVEGTDSYFEFKTNVTTTSTRSTTRTTYRTITTRNSTVRARSANTDDPRHLPVWIGLVAVSALMLGAVYFVKERD